MMEDVAIRLRHSRQEKESLLELTEQLKRSVAQLYTDLTQSRAQEEKISKEFFEVHDANTIQFRYGIHNPTWRVTAEAPTTVDVLEHRVALAHSFFETIVAELDMASNERGAAEQAFAAFQEESRKVGLALDDEVADLQEATRSCQEEYIIKQRAIHRHHIVLEEMKGKTAGIVPDSNKAVLQTIKELFADKPFAPALARTLL